MKEFSDIQVHSEVEATFALLHRYLNMTSKLLIDECEHNAEQTGILNIIQYHFEYTIMLDIYYPYSFVILLYANVEKCINLICNYLKDYKSIPKGHLLYEGNLGRKMQSFLSSNDFKGFTIQEQQEFNKLNIVRNTIVHNNGFINVNEKANVKLMSLIKKDDRISLKYNTDQMVISLEYCKESCAFLERAFIRILKDNNITSWREKSSSNKALQHDD